MYVIWNTTYIKHFCNYDIRFLKNCLFILIFAYFSINFPLLSKIFTKSEAEHVLKMFLKYPKNWASCSYKLGSYKKKSVYKDEWNRGHIERLKKSKIEERWERHQAFNWNRDDRPKQMRNKAENKKAEAAAKMETETHRTI